MELVFWGGIIMEKEIKNTEPIHRSFIVKVAQVFFPFYMSGTKEQKTKGIN